MYKTSTNVIAVQKINDTSFYIDVLYFSSTSYSKSLYPTITRAFYKYSSALGIPGAYNQSEEVLYQEPEGQYTIKRITFNK